MWKCQYCDKTSLDDKTICPYCNAPNPAAQMAKSVNVPQSPAQMQSGRNQPAQDWESRYSPPKSKKPNLRNLFTYSLIGITVVLLIVILTLISQKSEKNGSAMAAPQKTEGVLKGSADDSTASAIKETPAPTPTPEPTRAPVVVDAVTELYLDFGQTYQCSTGDFVLPYEISNSEVSWRCAQNDCNTTCSKGGLILAGNIQLDCEKRYNDEIIVTGTTAEGSVLTYHVITGNGETHLFDWSNSPRTMKGYSSGYVIAAAAMVVQCSGFSLYYEYELTDGELDANSWSVWVREDGKTWIRVEDIHLKNMAGDVFDITFDRPITFNEICVQPETYSTEYTCSTSFYIGYLIFDN